SHQARSGPWLSMNKSRPQLEEVKPQSSQWFPGPTIGHQYTSPVNVNVISPAAAAARTSLSENNCRGVCPRVNAICTSSQMGLKPSVGIASITEMKGCPPGNPGSD